MKQIYEIVKSIQNQSAVRYRSPSINEDYDDDLYVYEDNYSEDEGTYTPIVTNSTNLIKSSIINPQDSQSKLLSGYTNGNIEINVNVN